MHILMDDCISDVDCSIDQPNIDRMFSRSDINLARPHAGGSEHHKAILLLPQTHANNQAKYPVSAGENNGLYFSKP